MGKDAYDMLESRLGRVRDNLIMESMRNSYNTVKKLEESSDGWSP